MSNPFDPNAPHQYANTKIVRGFTAGDPAMLRKGRDDHLAKMAWWREEERLREQAEAQARAQANARSNAQAHAQAQARAQAQVSHHCAHYGGAPSHYSMLTHMVQNPQSSAAQQAQLQAQQQAAAGQNAA